jgi:hypothetical protein
MAGAVPGGELWEVDPGRVREPERLGDSEWPVDELALEREQLDSDARPGQLVTGEQRLEPGHPAARDDHLERSLTPLLDQGDAHVQSLALAIAPASLPAMRRLRLGSVVVTDANPWTLPFPDRQRSARLP